MKRFITTRDGRFYVIYNFLNDQQDNVELEDETGNREILPMYRVARLIPRDKLEVLRLEFNQQPV